MPDSGREVEAEPRRQVGIALVALGGVVVVVHRLPPRDQRIGAAVPHQDLRAALAGDAQIGAHDVAVGRDHGGRELRLVVELRERQRPPVEGGVAVRPALPAEVAAGRVRGDRLVRAVAEREPDAPAVVVARPVPDPVHRLRFHRGEAVRRGRRAGLAADIGARVKVAAARIGEEAVGHTVERVARRDRGGIRRVALAGGDGAGRARRVARHCPIDPPRPERGELQARVEVGRRADEVAVERVAMRERERQALAAAGGAAAPVVAACRRTVIGLRQPKRGLVLHAQAGDQEVVEPAVVQLVQFLDHREVRVLGRGMARVRRRADVAGAGGAVTPPTLPARPPPPRFITLPFQAPCTPPAPPSALLSGRPTRITMRWSWPSA